MKKIIVLLILVAAVGSGAAWYMKRGGKEVSSFRTAQVTLGDLVATISATGTVEPEEVVDVGAQVAGQIYEFGKDTNDKTIDYRSHVEAGMVLAKIDTSLYEADVAQAQASLAQAKASEVRAEADLGQMKAKLTQAQSDWERAQKLGVGDALAESTYIGYKAAYETAAANLNVGEAAVKQAKASVLQAEAMLKKAQRNLDLTTIKSPVKGTIISRRVNIGQTVVSSLNAPSLFLIAKDLKKMQVWVQVNEADIGRIYPGQPVTFTVDARPGETFKGTVGKIRLDATMTQNVVTYTVEVQTDNSDERLLPYLSANVKFETGRRDHVLMVPNAALSFTPETDQIALAYRNESAAAPGRGGMSAKRSAGETANATTRRAGGRRMARGDEAATTQPATAQAEPRERNKVLWVKEGDFLKPIQVKAGLTDGAMTEVEGEGVTEGMEVVVGEDRQTNGPTDASNPFMPQIRRARPGSSAGGAGAPGAGGGQRGGGPGGGPGGGGPGGGMRGR